MSAERDKKNEEMSDALIVFLVDRPLTGKGSLSTLNKFRSGQYGFQEIPKPKGADFLIVRGKKPSLIFWDIELEKLEQFSQVLGDFVNQYRPKSLMIAGSTASTNPQVEELGAALFRLCWSVPAK